MGCHLMSIVQNSKVSQHQKPCCIRLKQPGFQLPIRFARHSLNDSATTQTIKKIQSRIAVSRLDDCTTFAHISLLR